MQKICLALIVLALAACGKSDEKPKNFLETQQKELQKARTVEQDLQKAAAAQSKEVEKQTDTAASNANQ
jgi:hypothetical protein